MPGKSLLKYVHFTGSSYQFQRSNRLNGKQQFCAFHNEMCAFRVKCAHFKLTSAHFMEINF